MKKITHIFWDFNGTILDDLDLCFNILNHMLETHGRPLVTKEQYLMIFDFPIHTYYNQVFDLKKTPFDDLANEFIIHYQEASLKLKLHQDVTKVISHAKQLGIKNIILSASEVNRLNEQLNHYGIKHLFDDILGTTDIYAYSKKDVFESYLIKHHIKTKHVLMIGDTLHDAHIAKAFGADVWLFTQGHQHESRLKNFKTFNHFNDLIDIISIYRKKEGDK